MLHLSLEENVEFSSLHQALSEIYWDDDVHDVYLLNHNSVWVEFLLKFILQLGSKLSFDITNPLNFDSLQEIQPIRSCDWAGKHHEHHHPNRSQKVPDANYWIRRFPPETSEALRKQDADAVEQRKLRDSETQER
jgi:hypothetical protein